MTLKQNSESATPEHYQKDGQDLLSHLEHIMPEEEMRGSYRFNIMKYATRAGRKDDIVSEINKIIEYAKRWKEFEESKENQSLSVENDTWSEKDYGNFVSVLRFMTKYYDGREILSYIDKSIPDDRICRLTSLDGKPANFDGDGFVVTSDFVTSYSKKQLMTLFNLYKNNKYTGLEILMERV